MENIWRTENRLVEPVGVYSIRSNQPTMTKSQRVVVTQSHVAKVFLMPAANKVRQLTIRQSDCAGRPVDISQLLTWSVSESLLVEYET